MRPLEFAGKRVTGTDKQLEGKMLVCNKPEYKALVQAIMVANGYNNEQAEYALENAIVDIEQGEESYFSAAIALNLRVNLAGQCGFDAADYLASVA